MRVCVPCYKEPMSVIEKTVNAALNADLPIGTKRTVYLCDDGNMDEKRVFAEDLQRKGRNIVYVRDRPKHRDGEWQCTIHVAGYLRDTPSHSVAHLLACSGRWHTQTTVDSQPHCFSLLLWKS